MSLRKIAVLLAAGGLAVGLIGGGVGAQFADQVTATQNFNVGTFSCIITDGGGGTVSADQKSVEFTSPSIMSSAAGTAPFHFTVQNSGQINAQLTVSEAPALSSPWSYMPITPGASFPLAASVSQVIGVGVQWTPLSQSDTGTHGTVTYTVNCGEVPPVVPGGPLGFFGLNSTNADNLANTTPGRVGGGIGPNVTAVDNGGGSITLTFSPGSQTGYQSCFEYAINGNAPEQRLVASVGPPIVYRTNYLATLTDGMWPFKCVGDGAPATDSVTVNVGVGGHVQVRMSFGAEGDYRFDWTQFNAV